MRYCKLIIMRIPDSTSICHIHHHNLHEHIPGRYTDCLQFPQEFKKIQLLYITWCNQGCDNNISKIKCPLSLESDSQNRAAFRCNLKFWLGFRAEPQQVFAIGNRQGNALFQKCHDTCTACQIAKSKSVATPALLGKTKNPPLHVRNFWHKAADSVFNTGSRKWHVLW